MTRIGLRMGSSPAISDDVTGDTIPNPLQRKIYPKPSWKTPRITANRIAVGEKSVSRARAGKPMSAQSPCPNKTELIGCPEGSRFIIKTPP